jgi:Uma2 family endonuclease
MSKPSNLAQDLITVEDYFRLVPDGQKADLIDGVIYMASPDSRRSNELMRFIVFLLTGFTKARGIGGEVFASRFTFVLSELRAPEPDVAYVRPERVHLIGETRMQGGPDIAVEVVSRESRSRDYGEKKQLYQEAGVSEYWIVDPLQQRVEFHRLQGDRYELAPLVGNNCYDSVVIPGLYLNVDWLLADPLPNEYECLQHILQEAAR